MNPAQRFRPPALSDEGGLGVESGGAFCVSGRAK